MLSIQRRFERYRIIYVWKILENFAPNCGIVLIKDSEDTRLGRRLKVPLLKGSAKINRLKEQALQIHGSKLFNCLPSIVRNQTRKPQKQHLFSPGPE